MMLCDTCDTRDIGFHMNNIDDDDCDEITKHRALTLMLNVKWTLNFLLFLSASYAQFSHNTLFTLATEQSVDLQLQYGTHGAHCVPQFEPHFIVTLKGGHFLLN